jgi:D-3-phosphoglycerate dehydrogenase
MAFQVLVTDYAWPSLATEARVLAEVGAGLIVAETGEEAELVRLAPPLTPSSPPGSAWGPQSWTPPARCRIVSRYGVGVDNIAVDHAELGIVVTNVPDYCAGRSPTTRWPCCWPARGAW